MSDHPWDNPAEIQKYPQISDPLSDEKRRGLEKEYLKISKNPNFRHKNDKNCDLTFLKHKQFKFMPIFTCRKAPMEKFHCA